jgi:hypothetical protein
VQNLREISVWFAFHGPFVSYFASS